MLWFLSSIALARPTSGGLFSFEAEDVIETYDLEMIRVHYSVEGPSLVLQGDEDLDGIPDFVEMRFWNFMPKKVFAIQFQKRKWGFRH